MQVLPLLACEEFSLVVLALILPQLTGQELLKQIKTDYSAIPVMIASVINQVAMTIDCIKAGAFRLPEKI
jgi:FixJ family two-component response regulator